MALSAALAGCGAAAAGRHPPAATAGDARRGQQLFEYTCDACHYARSSVARAGPGLAGLYSRVRLRNGAPVNDASVERFIRDGTGVMPGYHDKLSAAQMRDLIAYLRTL